MLPCWPWQPDPQAWRAHRRRVARRGAMLLFRGLWFRGLLRRWWAGVRMRRDREAREHAAMEEQERLRAAAGADAKAPSRYDWAEQVLGGGLLPQERCLVCPKGTPHTGGRSGSGLGARLLGLRS